MNIRIFHTAAWNLAVIAPILFSSLSNSVSAAITATKNSIDFNTKSWEGDVWPSKVYGVDINDWSVDGGNYTVVQDGNTGAIGSSDAFSAANGWTIEWRMMMDVNNLPTAVILDENDVLLNAGRGSLTFQLADGQSTTGRWTEVTMGQTGGTEWAIWDALTDGLMWRGGDITQMTTVRIAAEATGGDDQYKMYVDGVDVLDIAGTAVNVNRQWFGDIGAAVSGGTAIVDYIRYDTTGAYFPFEISFPAPTSNWTNAAGGDWNTGSNWDTNPIAPNSNLSVAGFGDVIASPRTVTHNAAVTLNGIVFGDTNPGTVQPSYTIAGSGSVTLDANFSSPAISVVEGSHEFTVDVNLNDSAKVGVAAGSSLNLNNSLSLNGNTLTKGGSGTVNINGTVNTGIGGSVVVAAGVLNGTGTVNGVLTNAGGTVAPGASPGKLSVVGDYNQTSGSLLIEIDGTTAETQHDVLDVTGDLTISDGSLDVVLGFAPAAGNVFDILDFGTADLSGATVNLPPVALDLAWDSTQLPVNGTISVVSIVPTLEWNVDGLGDWNAATNWKPVIGMGTTPNSNIERVVFGSAITSPHTVTTDAAAAVKGITFDNSNTYVIAGAGSVTLSSDNNSSTVNVLQGDHQFQAVVNLSNATDVDVAASSSLAFNNVLDLAGNTLTKMGTGTMRINNDLITGGGTVVVAAGVLSGGGTVGGDVTNNGGTLSPGNSPGILEITGDYAQNADGGLLVEIGGTDPGSEFDVLEVAGTASLAGELAVVLLEGYRPAMGDRFDILEFGSLSGTFDTVILPALSGGLVWDDSGLYGSGSLLVTAVPEPTLASLLVVVGGALALVARRRQGIMSKDDDV
jgi:hypothetical protein